MQPVPSFRVSPKGCSPRAMGEFHCHCEHPDLLVKPGDRCAPSECRLREAISCGIAAGAPKSGVPDFGKSWWAQVGNIRLALRPRNDESASASRHCARHRRQLARGTCSSPVFSGARRLRPTSIWTFASRGRARRAAVIPLYFNARAAPGLRAPGSPPAAARGGGLGRCCVRRRRRFAGRLCAPGRRRGGA
jgi:hypothetical protein